MPSPSAPSGRTPAAGPDPGASWHIQEALRRAPAYGRWIHALCDPHVGRRVLDAGCGMGTITRLFLDRELVVGVEREAAFCARVREELGPEPNFRLVCEDLLSPALLALAGDRLDTVLCLNVLEHLPDDLQALRQFRALLVPGGRLVLFVPAHQWLYGAHDRADGHYRRYSRRALARLLPAAGFRVERLRWVNLLGIPAWLLNKLLRRTLDESQCSAFDVIVPLAAAVERVLPPPVGLSLLAVATPEEDAAPPAAADAP